MDIQYIFIDTGSAWDWGDQIPALASGIIALCALLTSCYQAFLSRSHNRLSIRPHLALHVEQRSGLYKIVLRNDGIGPAIITSATIKKDGALIDGVGMELIENAISLVPDCRFIEGEFFRPDFVLPAGGEISIASIEHNPLITDFDTYLSNHLELNLKYKSAYNEIFLLDSHRP